MATPEAMATSPGGVGVYLALAPLLVVALGGCGLMLAEAFSGIRDDHHKAGLRGPSSELALSTAVCLFAGALVAGGVWMAGPETIQGAQSVVPRAQSSTRCAVRSRHCLAFSLARTRPTTPRAWTSSRRPLSRK